MPQTKKTRSTYACEATAATKSNAVVARKSQHVDAAAVLLSAP